MIDTYVWKEKKVYNEDGSVKQNQIKLVDCSEHQLQKYYDHCMQMLYNESADKPGRYSLLKTINSQRSYCNAELFVRYLRSEGISQISYLQDLRQLINNNKKDFPNIGKSELANFIDDEADLKKMPVDFHILQVDDIISACMDKLGKFDKQHLTLSFILNQGIWLSLDDQKELTEKNFRNEVRDFKEVIKERLNLLPTIELRSNPKGLNYTQFKAMIQLKSIKYVKYSELSSIQLTTLRDKVLYSLEDTVILHIAQWEDRKCEILKVAEYLGFNIIEKELV